MTNIQDIKNLIELFQQNQVEEEQDCVQAGPSKDSFLNSPYNKVPDSNVDKKDIALEEDFIEDNKTWKKTPTFSISYKQQVTSSDVFLQMGFKTPSTSSCEDMLVTISLPGEKRQNIELKVFNKNIKVESPRFFLDLTLPHPVDPQRGNAQFNSDEEQLVVTLRMVRELDLVNF